MKNLKKIGIISNVVFSLIYLSCSWILSFFGLLVLINGFLQGNELAQSFLLISGVLFLGTVLFCIVGIVLSIIFRMREKYVASFLIQLLPFGSTLLALLLMAASMVLMNL